MRLSRSAATLPLRSCLVILVVCLVGGSARAQGDLGALTDEFEESSTLANWGRVQTVEQWNIEPLEIWDIAVTTPGRMTMMPYTVTWFQDYVGPYAFKSVTGDFVITSQARSTGRDGVSVPQSQFSLGGIMIRAPRNVTPATWTPGGEDYVFLSVGYGNRVPSSWQYEVKTTDNSNSTLFLTDAPGPEITLQTARLGPYVITLRHEPGQSWVVHRRYARPDFPATMQVGLVAYTDWDKVQFFSPFVHNQTVLRSPLPNGVVDPQPGVPFHPDLITTFDYARYFRPTIPPALAGLDLSNPAQVSDAELLSFLGENANVQGATAVLPIAPTPLAQLRSLPEPANGRATLQYSVAVAGPVSLCVYDLAGRLVRELVAGARPAGDHATTWDGRDAHGVAARSGVYVVRLETPGRPAAIRRIHLLR